MDNKALQECKNLPFPPTLDKNKLYLGGSWDIQSEFAKNTSAGAAVMLQYNAEDVHMVARADAPVRVKIRRDGQDIGEIVVQEDGLYDLIDDESAGEHTLELIITEPGLQAFTFTFG